MAGVRRSRCQVLAGNVTAMTLAELGADVVKIEFGGRARDPNRVGSTGRATGPRARRLRDQQLLRLLLPQRAQHHAGHDRRCRPRSVPLPAGARRRAPRELRRRRHGAVGPDPRAPARSESPAGVRVDQRYGRTGPRARAAAYGANISACIRSHRVWLAHGTHLDYEASATAVAALLARAGARGATDSGAACASTSPRARPPAAMMAPSTSAPSTVSTPPISGAVARPTSPVAGVFACAGEQRGWPSSWRRARLRRRGRRHGCRSGDRGRPPRRHRLVVCDLDAAPGDVPPPAGRRPRGAVRTPEEVSSSTPSTPPVTPLWTWSTPTWGRWWTCGPSTDEQDRCRGPPPIAAGGPAPRRGRAGVGEREGEC